MALDYISRLPSDLLDLIFSHLPIAEYIRAGIVCRSWRQATVGKPHRRNPKSPLLMFPAIEEGSDDPDSFKFFSITDLMLSRLRLPQIRGKEIVGSSHGSIIATNFTEILLLDPLTGAKVSLPPASVYNDFDGELEYRLVEKLVFLPSKSVAVAIYVDENEGSHYLSFARSGDRSWTVLREKIYHTFCDVIIHRGDFYMVKNNGTILSFDPAEGGSLMTRGYYDPSLHAEDQNPNVRMYLVESLDRDHLLLVCRMMVEESWMTNSFKVFRQDKVGLRWVEAGSLGEVAIFVGSNYSTCVFTRGLPKLRGNCIYFTGDQSLQQTKDDFGVFDLADGSIQQLVTLQNGPPSSPPPFWIIPNAQ